MGARSVPFTAHAVAICAALGPGKSSSAPLPWQKGQAECFNRTLQAEWAYRRPYTTNTERAAALAPWLEHYTQRPHTALGGQPPISRVTLSPT